MPVKNESAQYAMASKSNCLARCFQFAALPSVKSGDNERPFCAALCAIASQKGLRASSELNNGRP